MGEGTTATGEPTRAPRASGPDEARGTKAGLRGTPEGHAAGHNHGTGSGAKQQRPPGAVYPDSAHHTHTTTAREAVPSNTQTCEGRPSRRTPATGERENGVQLLWIYVSIHPEIPKMIMFQLIKEK